MDVGLGQSDGIYQILAYMVGDNDGAPGQSARKAELPSPEKSSVVRFIVMKCIDNISASRAVSGDARGKIRDIEMRVNDIMPSRAKEQKHAQNQQRYAEAPKIRRSGMYRGYGDSALLQFPELLFENRTGTKYERREFNRAAVALLFLH